MGERAELIWWGTMAMCALCLPQDPAKFVSMSIFPCLLRCPRWALACQYPLPYCHQHACVINVANHGNKSWTALHL